MDAKVLFYFAQPRTFIVPNNIGENRGCEGGSAQGAPDPTLMRARGGRIPGGGPATEVTRRLPRAGGARPAVPLQPKPLWGGCWGKRTAPDESELE